MFESKWIILNVVYWGKYQKGDMPYRYTLETRHIYDSPQDAIRGIIFTRKLEHKTLEHTVEVFDGVQRVEFGEDTYAIVEMMA